MGGGVPRSGEPVIGTSGDRKSSSPAQIHRSNWLKTTNPQTNLLLLFLTVLKIIGIDNARIGMALAFTFGNG
jgi:hypothetical protein